MSANSNNNWRQQLWRWLIGDSTRMEEWQLDQTAQDDPFLADALEGYRNFPEENHVQQLTEIKARLRGKAAQKRVFPWMRVAAIGAFLIFALWGIQQLQPTDNQEFAKTTIPTKPTPKTSTPEHQSNKTTEKITSDERRKKKETIDHPNTPTNEVITKKKREAPKSTITKDEIIIFEDVDIVEKIEKESEVSAAIAISDNTSSVKDQKADVVLPAPMEIPSALDEEAFDAAIEPTILGAKEETETNIDSSDALVNGSNDGTFTGRMVKGKVLSEEGEPLIGAMIFLTGTPSGTSTDYNGDFKITIPKDAASLDISFMGYENLRIYLEEEKELAIRLHEATNDLADAEAIVDKSTAKKRTSALSNSKMKAENKIKAKKPTPRGGIAKFEKYIQQNLRYPAAAKGRGKTDTVKVQFKVNKNGTLSQLKVLNPVGFGIDEEAIRLLQEGPKWKADGATVITYELIFKEW